MVQNAGEVPAQPIDSSVAQSGDSTARRLNLIFYDYRDNPEDKLAWSGTASHIILGLRRAGQQVTAVGPVAPQLRRALISPLWHGYRLLRKQHYIADRHMLFTRLFTAAGNRRLRALADAEAILTVSTTCAAFLRVRQPIFLLLDATWGQVVELYPYFARARQPGLTYKGGFALDRAAFRKPNLHVVMTSQWAADRAIAEYGTDPARVHVLPFGANLAEDPARDVVERSIDARTGRHCHLLFVGREFERKGGPIAVAVAGELQARGIPVTLHVVGCEPKNMPDFVTVHGYLSKERGEDTRKLERLYLESDFFLMPTRAEAQGIVFNEAAAFGLPVAATDVGGVSTVVRGGDWGLLPGVDAPVAEYADWLAELFRDRERYRQAARRARDDFDTRLSSRSYTRGLLAIMDGVLGSRSPELGASR